MYNLFGFIKNTRTPPSSAAVTGNAGEPGREQHHKMHTQLTLEQSQLLERVEHCYRLAETYFEHTFPRPEVGFTLRGKSAGTAHLQQNRLRFNPVLLAENSQVFIEQVVPHEICHLLAFQRFGKVKPHGQEWQSLMLQVYQVSPSTTHSFDTQSVAGKSHAYLCGCGPVTLSVRRHNKVVRGETQYHCRRCKQILKRV